MFSSSSRRCIIARNGKFPLKQQHCCISPFFFSSYPSSSSSLLQQQQQQQLRSYCPPPPHEDHSYNHISNQNNQNPENSSPPSQWDRISKHENPSVSRPSQVYQSMAPREGLPPIRIRKVSQNKYWKPTTMMVVLWLFTFWGMHEMEKFRAKRHLYNQEEELHRSALIAFLQSEKDIAYAVEKRAFDKKVAELMKDEPDFILNQNFYHTERDYREPLVFPTMISFEESGMLQRDLDRLQEMIDEYKAKTAGTNTTGRQQLVQVAEKLSAIENA